MKRILLLSLIVLSLVGCATSVRYVNYTDKKFLPKSKYYFIMVYPDSQKLPVMPPYFVIGRVELSGFGSDGLSPDTLSDKAKTIARKRGADAIINARTEIAEVGGMYAVSQYRGYHHYRTTEYIPYSDQRLSFRGDLIVFKPPETNEQQ